MEFIRNGGQSWLYRLYYQLCVSCRIDTWQIRVGPPSLLIVWGSLSYNIHVSQLGETCLTFFSLWDMCLTFFNSWLKHCIILNSNILHYFYQMFSNHTYGFIVLKSSYAKTKRHFTLKKSLHLVSIFDFCSFRVFIVVLFFPNESLNPLHGFS